uniref:Bm9546 n=1 Tax=Brugia malayi TaxID=6279 RepID=A0A7I4KSH1_BRUMA
MMNKKIHGIPIKEYFTNLVSKKVEVEPNNPAFRCFNNKFHVYPVAKFMFMLSMSCWLIILGILFPWSIMIVWIAILYFLLTIYALQQKQATCLWPAIIHSALAILIWLSGTVVLFTTALFSTQTFLDTFGQVSGHQQQFIVRFLIVLMIKTAIILVGLYFIYQLFVFNQCRKYFDHVRNADLPQAPQEEAVELEVIQDKP